MKDLHIHIERGDYTKNWIDRFVSKAVETGLDEICLLEHSVRIKEFHPCFKEACEYSDYQRKWFNGKVDSAHTMAEYRSLIDEIRNADYPIKVSFGLEICWFEQHEDYIKELVSDGYFDYLLGSVHWIDNWTFNQRKYQWLGKDANTLYRRYYEMSQTLINSGIFDIIAHPDLIRCHGIYADYDLCETYKSLCEAANENGVKIEMNTSKSLGINPQFFEIARKSGADFTTGSDAHRPEDVGRKIKEVTDLLK